MTQKTNTYYILEYEFEGKTMETLVPTGTTPIDYAIKLTDAGAKVTGITMQKIPTV